MLWLSMLLIAAIAGYGAAIVLVEKKSQWPASALRPYLQTMLGFIYRELPAMLDCSTCTSFWTSLFAYLYLSLCNNFEYWYYAPISGLIGVAVTWSIIEMMNAIDATKVK